MTWTIKDDEQFSRWASKRGPRIECESRGARSVFMGALELVPLDALLQAQRKIAMQLMRDDLGRMYYHRIERTHEPQPRSARSRWEWSCLLAGYRAGHREGALGRGNHHV